MHKILIAVWAAIFLIACSDPEAEKVISKKKK